MLPIFRAGLGGPIGDGKQWMSWIHRTDLCNLINESVKILLGQVSSTGLHQILYE